jgi:hypothetical protein
MASCGPKPASGDCMANLFKPRLAWWVDFTIALALGLWCF